ncbi:hypothetical protein GQ457_08G016130 [Hibiscus cannabinus]
MKPKMKDLELEQMERKKKPIPLCQCGVPAALRTSWTKDNLGRKFFGCPNFQKKARNCLSFKWFDAKILDRTKVVIVGLLKSKGAMEKARKTEPVIWVIYLAFCAYLEFFRV